MAITELAKGIKSASFYPPGHPALTQTIQKIISSIENIPPPETGIEIGVTKNGLLFGDDSLPPSSKAVADLTRELYYRRASKLIFLPDQKPEEMTSFLNLLNRDIQDIQDEGGLERILLREKVSRIWVNRVDYEGLTEMLKREEEEPAEPEDPGLLHPPGQPFDLEDIPPEKMTVDELIRRLEHETDPAVYRDCVILLTRALSNEPAHQRIEYASRALAIFVTHIDRPPGNDMEISKIAAMGIKELVSDDLVAYYIKRLRDLGGRNRKEVETVLVALGERAVKAVLAALAEEEDILVRKSIVDIVVRIGPAAVPAILDNLSDSRWYVVRNMVTILGKLGVSQLAPQIVSVLPHPDLRVKKEAIKGLSKLSHQASIKALGELCFFPEETVALTATAALSSKPEPEAVEILYRRAVLRKVLYPNYRLAHESIDSLRTIDTDEAISALENILRATAIWETVKFRELKKHALRSISRMSGDRPREIVQRAANAPKEYLRVEAELIMKKTGG